MWSPCLWVTFQNQGASSFSWKFLSVWTLNFYSVCNILLYTVCNCVVWIFQKKINNIAINYKNEFSQTSIKLPDFTLIIFFLVSLKWIFFFANCIIPDFWSWKKPGCKQNGDLSSNLVNMRKNYRTK
jgi:hypothetical protein